MIMDSSNKQPGLEMLRVFKTLGDENRYQIIKLLSEGNLCVGALARILSISKPAVSQHLKLLREAGLVKGEKIGYFTHYRVEKKPWLRQPISFRRWQKLIRLTGNIVHIFA